MSRELIDYRIQQAEESLFEAEILFSPGKGYRGSVNRAYYSMFYSVLALLAETGKASSKHSGIISLFDENFVRTGIFKKEMSKSLHRAFDFRQIGDYRELFEIDEKDAQEIIEAARKFVNSTKEYLQKA